MGGEIYTSRTENRSKAVAATLAEEQRDSGGNALAQVLAAAAVLVPFLLLVATRFGLLAS